MLYTTNFVPIGSESDREAAARQAMAAIVNSKPTVTATTEKIRIKNLNFFYEDGSQALRNVSAPIYDKRVTAFMGPSGCGKSTLLRVLNRMHDLYPGQRAEGEILFDGEDILSKIDVYQLRARIGMVFQQFNLIPSLTVADNLVFQSRIAGRHDAAWHDELVERLGLKELLKRYPEQLSGGQQQRVAIGRALAPKPLLLLADEPTGNLDEDTADEVLHLARDLVARTGCGFLMVTHSARLAATLDRQVTLHAGVIA